MQSNYFTPIKTIQPQGRQLFNSECVQRQGDWVCVNCQNLNYSFRKKCNRCKTQSREDNEKHSVYSYYYYPRVDITPFSHETLQHIDQHPHSDILNTGNQPSQSTDSHQDNKENQPINDDWNAVMETPKKKKIPLSNHSSKLDGLPSVSPLVKKYHQKQHHTTLEVTLSLTQKLKNGTNLFDCSPSNKDFDSIKIRDFDKLIQEFNYPNGSKTEIEGSPFKQIPDEDDSLKFMKEIQASISRIII